MINFNTVGWSAAEVYCECFGTLARLDSQAEMDHFMSTFAKYVNHVRVIIVEFIKYRLLLVKVLDTGFFKRLLERGGLESFSNDEYHACREKTRS